MPELCNAERMLSTEAGRPEGLRDVAQGVSPAGTVVSLVLVCLMLPVSAWAQLDERMMYASVVDRAGQPVLDLGAKDFIVREDNVVREILHVAPDRDPMQVALLVDDSNLFRGREALLRRAVSTFIEHMRDDVMMALIGLGERPTIRVDYTRDKRKLLAAAHGLFGHGMNTLTDAIYESSTALAKRPLLRPVIVVVTAGVGGFKIREEVLRALKWSQASLHMVTLSLRGSMGGRMSEEVTSDTGGRNDVVFSITSLEGKLIELAGELSNQYRLTYARPQRLIPPEKTEVKARNPEYTARGMLVLTEEERQKLPQP
jgi:VWA domain-containing protein